MKSGFLHYYKNTVIQRPVFSLLIFILMVAFFAYLCGLLLYHVLEYLCILYVIRFFIFFELGVYFVAVFLANS